MRLQRTVDDVDLARLSVQLEEDGSMPVGMRIADRQELDNQGLARFDVDGRLFPRFETVEERRRGKDAGVGTGVVMVGEFLEHTRVKQVRNDFAAVGRTLELFGKMLGRGVEIGRWKAGSGTPADRFLVAQNSLADAGRESSGGLPHATGDQIDDRFGKRQFAIWVEHVLGLQVVRQQEQRHVSHRFRRGGDFDDIAEQLIDVGIHAAQFGPAIGQAQGGRLLVQVRRLPARHLVQIDVDVGDLHAALKRGVIPAHLFPVVGERFEVIGVQPRIAGRMAQRFDQRIQIRLRRHPRHGGEGRVGDIEPLFGSLQDRRPLHAAHVVRMEVDWNADFAFERFNQFFGGVGFA